MATENDVSVTLNAVTVSEVTVNDPINGGGHNKDDDSILIQILVVCALEGMKMVCWKVWEQSGFTVDVLMSS